MPQYYFDVLIGQTVVRDEVGQEFAADSAAVNEAALLAEEFKGALFEPEHAHWTEGHVIVRNGSGREVARASFFVEDERRLRVSPR